MKKAFSLVLAVALALALVGGAVAAEKITMTGSTTVLPIAQKAAEVYMQKNPDVAISVAGTGSGDGIKAIIDGTADIGNASRDMKDKEVKLAESKGVKPVRHVVALDCIVPVVHPSNPVSRHPPGQAQGHLHRQDQELERGRRRWTRVIVVISRDSSSGTFEVWNEKVLDKERVRPDAQLQASNGAVAQAVAGNKYAIGYVGIGYLNDKLKGLSINGVTASAKTAMDKSYPVARALLHVHQGRARGVRSREFLDFVKSRRGSEDLAEKEGFVKAAY